MYIKAATSGTYHKIGNTLRENPELCLPNRDNVVELIVTYRRSFTTEQSKLLKIIEKDYKVTGSCRLHLAKESWYNARDAYAFQKSSHLTSYFNEQ